MAHNRFVISAALILASVACASAQNSAGDNVASPTTALDGLLAADRAFSSASMRTDVVSGLTAMFAPDVALFVPGRGFTSTADEAAAALRSVADNATSHIEWTPVRGGISGDGMQGFTFGYMTLHKADGSEAALKYLAYWVKRPEGWRVVAYKRRLKAAGAASLAMRPAALPDASVRPTTDQQTIERFRASLDQAERAFSDDAQKIGLAAAFARWGTADAVNMGGPSNPEFVVGSEAIGKVVGVDEPATGSSVSWAPDRVIIASSGDLGVTIGTIRVNNPSATDNGPKSFPFFTVWRRGSSRGEWKYIAE